MAVLSLFNTNGIFLNRTSVSAASNHCTAPPPDGRTEGSRLGAVGGSSRNMYENLLQRTLNLLQLWIGHMRVELRGPNVLMTQELLNVAYINAVFQ